jgi:hypothetical protein
LLQILQGKGIPKTNGLSVCYKKSLYIQIIEEAKIFSHHTPEEWWDSLSSHGTRAKFEQLSSDQITSLRERALKKASSLATDSSSH